MPLKIERKESFSSQFGTGFYVVGQTRYYPRTM